MTTAERRTAPQADAPIRDSAPGTAPDVSAGGAGITDGSHHITQIHTPPFGGVGNDWPSGFTSDLGICAIALLASAWSEMIVTPWLDWSSSAG